MYNCRCGGEASAPEEQLIMQSVTVCFNWYTRSTIINTGDTIYQSMHIMSLKYYHVYPVTIHIGGWVASTNAPTPLIVIYQNTDLIIMNMHLVHINILDEDAYKRMLFTE